MGYKSLFLVSTHSSKYIKATIQAITKHGAEQSTTEEVVKVHPKGKVHLGCIGEQLSGAPATRWERKILAAWFE